jgi:eukaryotic-like serine/threonine-protein kinase
MADTVIAGRYALEHLLGRGGMSEVYCAQDQELGRRVALKLLAPDADTARFEREARAVASLAHPNVTQLYDYGEDNGRPYMVLEYVPGGTLEDRLAETDGAPLPDDETRLVSAGIAAGLAHAHARGVVHRDLKPANVLFDEEGRPKLADFGIARMVAGEGTLTEAGTVLGTAAYISPEQASGAPATAASDVYSFGVMLYRMLTGRLPFESSDPMELVLMNRDQAPPPIAQFRSDAPAELESTATAALEKDAALRPRDGAALLTALGVAGGAALTTATTALAADATQVLPVAGASGAGTTATAGATSVMPGAPAAATGPPVPPPPAARSRLPLALAALLVLLLAGGALAYEVTRPPSSSNDPGRGTGPLPTISLPHNSTRSTTKSTPSTTAPATTAPPTTTTAPTTSTEQTTTSHTTTAHTTTAHTTTAPTTTAPPPTTTAPPPPTTTTTPTTTATPTTAPSTTASAAPPATTKTHP